MIRSISLVAVLLLVFALVATPAMAAQKAPPRVIHPALSRNVVYSFSGAEEGLTSDAPSNEGNRRIQLGSSGPGSASPGVKVGDTWYDYQRNGSMRRMVGNGPHSGVTGDQGVHFMWMYLPQPVMDDRTYAYNGYTAATGGAGGFLPGGVALIQGPNDYAGYVSGDVTKDNRAVVGGHNNQLGGGYATHVYYDFDSFFAFFGVGSRVPDSVQTYAANAGAEVIWPAVAYQETGAIPVTHAFGQLSDDAIGAPQSMYYFRKEGFDDTGDWDYPPMVVDTVFDIAEDISASRTSGKVMLGWVANLPADGDCATCSDNSGGSQINNDVYIMISNDWGVTWEPRVNVTDYKTQYENDGLDGYRAYTDVSTLITSDDVAHVIWSGRIWPGDPTASIYWNCRMFHWDEVVDAIRTIAVADWTSADDECTAGSWNMLMSKMQVSECNGRLYALWVQTNDVPNGVTDDCAQRGLDGDYQGSANGELFVSVSADMGLTWDEARNLTNSYSKGCDSASGVGGMCFSDNWPTMTRFGMQVQANADWSQAVTVDVSGSYAGDYFLDVQYIQDPDAGGIVQDEGTWQLADVAWFRMACVAEVPAAKFTVSPGRIAFPSWSSSPSYGNAATAVSVKTAEIENTGNVALSPISVTLEEDTGPAGWLSVTGVPVSVPSGLGNVASFTIDVNTGGATDAPGTTVYHSGRLIVTSNDPGSPDTMSIEHWVTDTLVNPAIDTLPLQNGAIVVMSDGNWANQGNSRLNAMDFVTSGLDCDSVLNNYIYDASTVLGYIIGSGPDDTLMNQRIFGNSYMDPNGFVPVSHMPVADSGDYYHFQGNFTSNDSTISIKKTWRADKAGSSGSNWALVALDVRNIGTVTREVTLGEAMDWDIPSDSGSDNASNFDANTNLIYQVGGFYDDGSDTLDDGTPNPCYVPSNNRYGGIAYIQGIDKGSFKNTPYGAYTAANSDYVYPAGSFVAGELYTLMEDNSGYSLYAGDPPVTDLHTVMTFAHKATLAPGDSLQYWACVATIYDGTPIALIAAIAECTDFARDEVNYPEGRFIPVNPGCCDGFRGDLNGDGSDRDIVDLTCVVDFLFGSGCDMPCPEEADANGDGAVADIVDLTNIVDFLFGDPPPAVPCP